MRRRDKEIKDVKLMQEVIHNAMVCRLALVKGSEPYIIPLNFGYDGKHLYFHSALSGEKVEILRENPRVCIEFEQSIKIVEHEKPCHWSANYTTVIIKGTAECLINPADKSYGLKQILAHYKPGEEYSFTGEEVNSVLVYKVNIIQMVGKQSS